MLVQGSDFKEYEAAVNADNESKLSVIRQLEQEKEDAELKILQEKHKKQRAVNVVNYRRKRSKSDKLRNHRLIHKGIAIETNCTDTEFLSEEEFYQLAEEIFSDEALRVWIAGIVQARKEDKEEEERLLAEFEEKTSGKED